MGEESINGLGGTRKIQSQPMHMLLPPMAACVCPWIVSVLGELLRILFTSVLETHWIGNAEMTPGDVTARGM
uniref:Uncharacterized protein n=1 Tax=Arundo donax TaxID=35708 RepID=A0A0A9GQT3_ARUDO